METHIREPQNERHERINMSKFNELREKFDRIIFHTYSVNYEADQIVVQYRFEIPGLEEFTPRWEFPFARNFNPKVKIVDMTVPPEEEAREVIEVLCFHLGMVELISYYKITCPKLIEVRAGNLTKEQAAWWKKLYYNGLGEFMYRNGISVSEEELFSFTENSLVKTIGQETGVSMLERKIYSTRLFDGRVIHDPGTYEGCLIPVGGGKDSVVTMELLRDEKVVTYHINEIDSVMKVIALYDAKQYDYCAKRVLDKRMIDLNAKGYLNGHTPFSAIVAFSSFIVAIITGKRFIPLSNETSANESTVQGSFVNHQYSKTYEFELDFTNYIRSVTDSDILYFSFLRPLAEIQIARIFSRQTKYLKTFRSCNVGSKKGIWCADCPKCLFVYIILTPFLPEEQLVKVFGEKLLDKESLDKDFRELIGIDENKPFECVGTRSEVGAAMKYYVERGGQSLLTDRYQSEILACQDSLDDMLDSWVNDNQVPLTYATRLQEALEW